MMNVTVTAPEAVSARLTRAETARILGISRHPLARLLDDGWATTRVEQVAALAARGLVTCDSSLVVLRLGAPSRDGDRIIGMAPDFSDQELVESARKWWVADPEAIDAAGHICVAIGGFAIALLHVDGIEESTSVTTDRGATVVRWAFKASLVARVDDLVTGTVRVVDPSSPAAELIPALSHRVPNPRGGPLIVIPPSKR